MPFEDENQKEMGGYVKACRQLGMLIGREDETSSEQRVGSIAVHQPLSFTWTI